MSGLFSPAPEPASKLGVYRVLSSRAGIHVSPIQLGAMSIGDKWAILGNMDKASSFNLLDAYFDLGGNFIDTANNYQDEKSEEWIGEWAEQRGIRDQLVLATKYSSNFKNGNAAVAQKVNFVGNNAKSLHLSVEASLKKLRTSYIDILYVHWWDWDTSIEEVMDSLHNLIVSGKVLYLGISDTPAWIVADANRYAKDHGKTPFAVYQGAWSILDRAFEREIIPMARAHGMALAPFAVLGHGKLITEAEEEKRQQAPGKRTLAERTPRVIEMSRALEKVAAEVGAKSITSVAIAYVMQKTTNVFPIIGGRKVENLKANLEALDITLSPEQIRYLESINPLQPEFPFTMAGDGTEYTIMMSSVAKMVKQPLPQPIKP